MDFLPQENLRLYRQLVIIILYLFLITLDVTCSINCTVGYVEDRVSFNWQTLVLFVRLFITLAVE